MRRIYFQEVNIIWKTEITKFKWPDTFCEKRKLQKTLKHTIEVWTKDKPLYLKRHIKRQKGIRKKIEVWQFFNIKKMVFF